MSKVSGNQCGLVMLALVGVLLMLVGCGEGPSSSPTAIATATTAMTPTATLPVTPTSVLTTTHLPPVATHTPILPTATATPELQNPNGPLGLRYLNFGVVVHLYYTDHERALQLAKNAGFDWVRQQIVWRDMEMFEPEHKYIWDQLDPIVQSVNNYGLKLLISVVQAPRQYNPTHGLPHNPADLGNFMEAMVRRYGNKIHAYEIWNEQNLAHETGGRIVPEDAGHYVEILKECYQRIKAVNPHAYILAGAPSSTGVTDVNIAISDLEYYRLMYTYQGGIIREYFDIQAVHPGGSANPPETLWPENPSQAQGWTDHSTFYFRHVEHVRAIMEEHGLGDHQVWITEYGWATRNTTPGYEFGNQVSMEQQAKYITGAIQYSYDHYPWLTNMFLWNLNFGVTWYEHLNSLRQKPNRTPEEETLLRTYWNEVNPIDPLHEQASFGILHGDWSPRPSYLAVQDLLARLKREQGR